MQTRGLKNSLGFIQGCLLGQALSTRPAESPIPCRSRHRARVAAEQQVLGSPSRPAAMLGMCQRLGVCW